MMEIAQRDWDALSALAERVGFPNEHISLLRQRATNTMRREGAPYTLLIGQQGAGIELLLGRWIGRQAVEEFQQSVNRPMVIGKRPSEVRPKLGTWLTYKWSQFEPGHLIALRSAGKPPADTLAQLASLGYADQVVIVTRLAQPLNLKERELARSCAPLSATARVLVVGLSGEENSEADLAELSAYAINQMRQAGFNGGRMLNASVWFNNSVQPSGTIKDVRSFLVPQPSEVSAGHDGMLREALAELLAELHRRASLAPTVAPTPLSEEELERLIRELSDYLSDLGREVERQIQARRVTGAESLRSYVSDALRGWGAYLGVEGHWLKYIERLRPGMHAAFMEEAEAALSLLDYEQGSGPVEPHTPASASSSGTFLGILVKRLVVSLIFVLLAYWLSRSLLNEPALPASLITIAGYVVLLLGAIVGYVVGSFIFRMAEATTSLQTEPTKPAGMYGWPQVERRVLAWFSQRMRASHVSPMEEYLALAERLQSGEKKS